MSALEQICYLSSRRDLPNTDMKFAGIKKAQRRSEICAMPWNGSPYALLYHANRLASFFEKLQGREKKVCQWVSLVFTEA